MMVHAVSKNESPGCLWPVPCVAAWVQQSDLCDVHPAGDQFDDHLTPAVKVKHTLVSTLSDVCVWCHAEARGWVQQAEACHPDWGPPPAAPRGQEHGLPEVQPPGSVPLHQIHPPGDALHPAKCSGETLQLIGCQCNASHCVSCLCCSLLGYDL